jgi:hypothetical protein
MLVLAFAVRAAFACFTITGLTGALLILTRSALLLTLLIASTPLTGMGQRSCNQKQSHHAVQE